MKTIICLTGVVFYCCSASTLLFDDSDLDDLQGEWKCERAVEGGKVVAQGEAQKWRFTFLKDKLTIQKGQAEASTVLQLRLDSSKTPKEIDLLNTETKWPWIGIYAIDKSKTKVDFCIGAPKYIRPHAFSVPDNADQASFVHLWTLTRAKKL